MKPLSTVCCISGLFLAALFLALPSRAQSYGCATNGIYSYQPCSDPFCGSNFTFEVEGVGRCLPGQTCYGFYTEDSGDCCGEPVPVKVYDGGCSFVSPEAQAAARTPVLADAARAPAHREKPAQDGDTPGEPPQRLGFAYYTMTCKRTDQLAQLPPG